MNPRLLLLAATLAALTSAKAEAQFVSERVVGLQRVCTYRSSTVGTETASHRVGIGDVCPAQLPLTDPASTPPSTARLVSEAIEGPQRVCNYVQEPRQWRVLTTLDRLCPISAGQMPRRSDDDED